MAEPSELDNDSDLRWRRLPDAPFSPRSDMQFELTAVGDGRNALQRLELLVVGGQTGHRCGLVELGVCSPELWLLLANVSGDPYPSLAQRYNITSYGWSTSASLPFASRCGAALLRSEKQPRFLLVGGQLSYADPSCRSPPAALNEVWISDYFAHQNLSEWRQDADASFSPRRSQQREDVLSVIRAQQDWQQLPPLAGGLRILNLTVGEGGQTQVGALQLYADAWSCLINGSRSTAGCIWGWQQQQQPPPSSLCSSTANSPTTSLPLPSALAPRGVMNFYFPRANQRFGGFTALAALSDWLSVPAEPEDDNGLQQRAASFPFSSPVSAQPDYSSSSNWTYLSRGPLGLADSSADICLQRQGLSLSYTLLQAELSASDSFYLSGSPWLQSHSPWAGPASPSGWPSQAFASVSTLHPQADSLAASPRDATLFLPQARDSGNTSRPQLRVSLPRLDAGYGDWSSWLMGRNGLPLYFIGQRTVSGGRRAGEALSDWLLMAETRCLPPSDAGFLSLLGPLSWSSQADSPLSDGDAASFAQAAKVTAYCAPGFSFSPPVQEVAYTTMFCGPNGLWLDTELLTVRRCLPNAPLTCQPPLTNQGGPYCEPARPQLLLITADGANSSDDLTVERLPVIPNTVLRISGSNFSEPLYVTVGGRRCEQHVLSQFQPEVCYNVSSERPGSPSVVRLECDHFAAAITCFIPSVLGLNLPVLVTSGRLGHSAEVAGSRVATVSSTAPVIQSLFSFKCSRASCNASAHCEKLQLTECSVLWSYDFVVCLDLYSVSNLTLDVYLGAAEQPLACVELTPSQTPGEQQQSRCLSCHTAPFVGSRLVRVRPHVLPLISLTEASLTSAACPAGFSTEFAAALRDSASPLCVACPVGSSTMGVPGAAGCVNCTAGLYAESIGTARCSQCGPGSISGEGADICSSCALNSYQPEPGKDSCLACDLGRYVVYEDTRDDSDALRSLRRARGNCTVCPAGAVCHSSGNITAAAGAFLIIAQQQATVSAVVCSHFACLDGTLAQCEQQRVQSIIQSELPVINCCAPGRYPAFSPQWADVPVLRRTEGVNVLCALCLPGHTQMNGDCIPCSGTHWGALLQLLLLYLLLVFLVHRLPHEYSGRATVSIMAYFLQQSALFLSFSSFFQLLSLVNLDLLGDSARRFNSGDVGGQQPDPGWCVVPMRDDYARFAVSLVSLPVAFLLLGIIALTQLAVYQLIRRAGAAQAQYLAFYSFVFPLAQAPPPMQGRLWSRRAELAAPLMPYMAEDEDEKRDAAAQPELAGDPDPALHAPLAPLAVADHVPSSAAPAVSPVWLPYQRSCVRLIQLSYTAIALLTIRFFEYEEVGQFGQRVADYPGMDPASPSYRTLMPLMILFLVFVCLLPVLAAVFLFLQHRRGVIRELKAARAAAPVTEAKAALILQLCCMFKPQYWWMAPFVSVRRLLLVSVLVTADESQTWIWLTVTNYLLLALHLQLEPYERAVDNLLESFTLLSLCLQTSLLCAFPPPFVSPLLLSAFNSLVLGPTVMLLAMTARRLWHRLKQRHVMAMQRVRVEQSPSAL